MIRIKVKDIVKAVNGILLCGDPDTIITDLCLDSREIKQGDLFVPIIGNNQDAHKYIEKALEIGAATLTSRHKGVVIADKPYIQVADTERALHEIGYFLREFYDILFIGVTGSVGKTTTREMIATALGSSRNVYQTSGNLNSTFGVPLTLARATEGAEVAVLEAGIGQPGEMEILSRLIKPQIAVVTMIGVAHMEHFHTRENIRKEKLEIINHMSSDGVLFLNGDDKMLADVRGDIPVQTFYYGTEPWCEYRAENIHMEHYRYVYDYVHGDKKVTVTINALGRHNVSNSLAGMAIADYMGLDIIKAARSYETFQGLRQRLLQIPGKYTIIDDTYNASPDSMRASIDVLSDLPDSGQKIAVFGDMFELGTDSEKYHYEIGQYMVGKKIDALVVVGELAQNIMKALQDANSSIKCYSFKDNGEVALYLMSVMMPEDVVLIKGSHGMHLNEIVSNLMG
ncbi:MAG: UDP-N-acetylmuramoyl-tripeptide--D-alanyl-D-alanine ligase [Eubacteriales bacterium]|nr:UDP-N-acetylmuramoyl-tripeptide--D-alanyl-D-alanine ligase [Lachnospiraceae bacterium]MDO5126360.1 UDP-N-acetylmuramoyl-tripeptide--D-alanyl-D-alanine ligase [Eubacteriales bacterium]